MTGNTERDALTLIVRDVHNYSGDAVEDLTYLITAHRFRETGLRGVIGEPDLALARPLAEFLAGEGYAAARTAEGAAAGCCSACGVPVGLIQHDEGCTARPEHAAPDAECPCPSCIEDDESDCCVCGRDLEAHSSNGSTP